MAQILHNIFGYCNVPLYFVLCERKKDKANIIGFGAMFLAYAGSILMMWN